MHKMHAVTTQPLRRLRRLRHPAASRAYHFASPGFDAALARAGVPAWGAADGDALRAETVAYLSAFDARLWHDGEFFTSFSRVFHVFVLVFFTSSSSSSSSFLPPRRGGLSLPLLLIIIIIIIIILFFFYSPSSPLFRRLLLLLSCFFVVR